MARLPAGKLTQRIGMGEPAWVRCPANPDRREILREHRAAREPRSSPAAVSLPCRQRRQRAAAAAPGAVSAQPLPADVTVTAAALGAVPTAEITIDGIELRHVVLYFHGGVYVHGGRFPRRRPGLAGRPADPPRSSPWTTGSPPSIRIRQRSMTLSPPTKPSWTTAGPRRTSLRGRVRRRRARHRHPGQRPRSRAALPPRRSPCHRMPTSPWPGRPWKPSERPTRC